MTGAGFQRMVAAMGHREDVMIITPLEHVEEIAGRFAGCFVCGLLGPEMEHPPLPVADDRRLKLSFHDIAAPVEALVPASAGDVAAIIGFARRWREQGNGAPLVFHCWMGVSRSPAAAFIAACALRGKAAEHELAGELRALAPFATPNRLLVELADEILGRGGRMSDAITAIGRGEETFSGNPWQWPLRA